ncbi:hypothetical protein TREMEDRAFT_28996 [Tremella mesenterica DSM 1558]|uniref:uncharacterized protein n=1 Tax=Tremella mesenterica (strain ATCC 24925 / CBS 8224 / DSM 1558 / NBRC 9311 / NRRL Y-6157 / RJB 2259-6 / UBC 559-6) TaxID=578456 RepID=UPI0003F49873|nr:uncharacterized protein TREMEDRAFT_28996 [Tremella mesenterica DSM 1558]EIW70659.1 hypothetical protein TREMEDRAFT_28996 [Tremella mesenterica DSM 1558]
MVQLDDAPSSSLPSSSQTFWNEVLSVQFPTLPEKRSADHLEGQQSPDAKRIHLSPSPLLTLHDSSITNDEQTTRGTALAYLPSRDEAALDQSHAYLGGAEYAPNRFGDIGDYMRKKEIKVQTQNRDIALASAASGLPQIFSGMSFYINGNTHPPMEELRKMILQRGGEVRPKLHKKTLVQYIIAPMLTQMKFKQFANYKVIREAWITESCNEGKVLDWRKWKLVPDGGWEQDGRKGLEGFLKGSQVQIQERTTNSPEIKQEISTVVDDVNETVDHVSPVDITTPQAPAAATQSLLKPIRHSIIPISPEAVKQESPAKEVLPPKVQQPEGWWEHYYSKESNEDAAKMLKNDEWRAKNTAERGNEGGYIDSFYQNSRLHHLSTWKAELKVLVAAAQLQSEANSLSRPSELNLNPLSLANSALPRAPLLNVRTGEKIIMHVDFDCFFVSCGLATRPHLRGKPTVVCHSQAGRATASTSEIASASYEARAKGVRNGMSLGRAKTLVGDELQTLPYEFETYKKFSLAFYTVLMGYADELQAVSVDEALIDVTSAVRAKAMAPEEAEVVGSDHSMDPAVEIAEKIRTDVRRETSCEVSIGIASNILLAKLATRRAKPAGIHHLLEPDIPAFLAPLDVEDFPSVGYSIRQKIETRFGSTIVKDLLEHPKSAFQGCLGPKTGEMVYGYLRGVDERKLEPHKERKSVSAEMNYGIRFRTADQAETCIRDLALEVVKRMKSVNARGRLLTLKLMARHPDAPVEPPKFLGHGWCETFNKSAQISKGGLATDDPPIMTEASLRLLRSMKLDPQELRGVGIQVTKLDTESQGVVRETGQAKLAFGTRRAMNTPTVAGPSRPGPSSEGIDPEFLAALPPDLRREVKDDYARSRSRSISIAPPILPKEMRSSTISPAKGKHAAAHITRQLRPKVKSQLKAGAIADLPLYGAWARQNTNDQDPSHSIGVELNDGQSHGGKIGKYRVADLRILGLDPDVFSELPLEMQDEVVKEERQRQQQRAKLRRPGQQGRFGQNGNREGSILSNRSSLSPTVSRGGSIPPHPKGINGKDKVVIVIPRPAEPTLYKVTELSDVLDVLSKWIESRSSPAQRDMDKVSGYLIRCIEGSLGGVEKVIGVLRWMRSVISDKWGDESEDGKEWWDAWGKMRGLVDDIAKRKFGAGLRV